MVLESTISRGVLLRMKLPFHIFVFYVISAKYYYTDYEYPQKKINTKKSNKRAMLSKVILFLSTQFSKPDTSQHMHMNAGTLLATIAIHNY